MSEISLEQRLLRAAGRILRPLVRVMVTNGVSAPVFQELMRKVYVDVAHEEFGIDGKSQTLARVSVLTGLNRKEVARLHKRKPLDESDNDWWNRAATVLISWYNDEEFQTKMGHPVDLPYKDGHPSFTDLVKKHSGDMYPRTIADELLRIGAIEEIDDRLRLTNVGYIPTRDPGMVIDILGRDTAELMETIVHNIDAEQDDKRYQYKIVSPNFPEEHLEEFNSYSRVLAGHMFDQLIDWLARHEKGEDWSGDDARFVAGVSAFHVIHEVRPKKNE